MMMNDLKRILLKLSGEALAGDKDFGFDEATCLKVAEQVKQMTDKGTQVAIVIGGGNFWRGRNSSKIIERTKSDQIGMLGTVMNCIYVSEIFRTLGMQTEVYTPFMCGAFTKLFSKDAAVADLNAGIRIFQRIQVQHFVPLRLRRMRFCLPRLWTVFMTVIRRRTRMRRSMTASAFSRL